MEAKLWAITYQMHPTRVRLVLIRLGGRAEGFYQQFVFLNLSLTGPLHKMGTKILYSPPIEVWQ